MSSETAEERVWLRGLPKQAQRELRRLRSNPPILQLTGAAIEQRHLRIADFDRLQTSGDRPATISLCSLAPLEREQDEE